MRIIRRGSFLRFDIPNMVAFALRLLSVFIEPSNVRVVVPEVGFRLVANGR
jgi:hypothetical protein